MVRAVKNLSLMIAATAVLVLATAADATAATVQFKVPSGNIGCIVDSLGARCDINKRSWKPPPKPRSCDGDYGQGLAVEKRGRGDLVCAGDTVLFGRKTVGYGDSVTRGRFRCRVKRSGVRCVNTRSRHGFSLSRQGYSRF